MERRQDEKAALKIFFTAKARRSFPCLSSRRPACRRRRHLHRRFYHFFLCRFFLFSWFSGMTEPWSARENGRENWKRKLEEKWRRRRRRKRRRRNLPYVWKHRSSAPSGPLPKRDQRTNQRTDKAAYRVACMQLKTCKGVCWFLPLQISPAIFMSKWMKC